MPRLKFLEMVKKSSLIRALIYYLSDRWAQKLGNFLDSILELFQKFERIFTPAPGGSLEAPGEHRRPRRPNFWNYLNFETKIKFFENNQNFGKKSKFWKKKSNFSKKSIFFKIIFFEKNQIFWKKIKIFEKYLFVLKKIQIF